MAVAWDDVLKTTLRNESPEVVDAVTNKIALLKMLESKGRITKTRDIGRTTVRRAAIAENESFGWFHDTEQLKINRNSFLAELEYDHKQASIAIIVSGREKKINGGTKTQIVNLLKEKMRNAKMTMRNRLEAVLHGDGTADGGRVFAGTALYFADDPTTGTVGGVDRATNTWARNQVVDFSTDLTINTITKDNIVDGMNALWNKMQNNFHPTDWIEAGSNFYSYYQSHFASIQRVVSKGVADAGFNALEFMGVPVILGGGQGGSMNADRMHFHNTEAEEIVVHQDGWMSPMDGERLSLNQDVSVQFLEIFGNYVVEDFRSLGVLKP
jgi:hypothetical protein